MRKIKIGNVEFDGSSYIILELEKTKTKIMLGKIDVNKSGDEFNVTSFGTRCFGLNKTDFKDFKRVLKIIQEDLNDSDLYNRENFKTEPQTKNLALKEMYNNG